MTIGKNIKFFITKHKMLSLALFIFSTFFAVWSNPTLKPHENGDTHDYISIAQDFSDTRANALRSFGYPLLIKLAMIINEDNWKKNLVILQIILHGVSIVLINNSLITMGYHKITCIIVTLLVSIHPSLLVYSNYLIAESFLSFFLVLYWYLGVLILKNKSCTNYYYKLMLLGVISSFSYMIKAVWIIGFSTIIIPLIFFLKKKEKIIYSLIIVSLFHFSFPVFWEVYKYDAKEKQEKMKYQSMIVNINFAAVRLGLIEKGKNTDLYQKIKNSGLLEKAKRCDGTDNKNFRAVYHGINFKDRYDINFTIKILKTSFRPFIFGQLKNIYRFYSDRMHVPSNEKAFYLMPKNLILFYFSGYNAFYRPFLILFILIGFFINFRKKINREIYIFNYSILIYFSTVLTIFTIAPVHMIRMRVPLDFLLIVHSIAPLLDIFISSRLSFTANNHIFKNFRIIRRN